LVVLALTGMLAACATPARIASDAPPTAASKAERASTPSAVPQTQESSFSATAPLDGNGRVDGVAGLQVIEIREVGRLPLIDLTHQPDDLWQRIRNGFAIPDLDNPIVLQRQAAYAASRTQLRINFERSRRYLYHIVEEIERRNMPTELALLPMVESSFNPMALSSARAAGLWQFIPSTGKDYKLEQNWWYDGRRDILASTSAALEYLQKLYEMWGDWHLALASYNWGEGAVGRAIEKNRAAGLSTDYMSLSMPDETRNYVPKLQAIKNIVLDPGAFGLELDPIANRPYFVTVSLTRDIDLDVAARLAEMPLEELRRLNPAHNRPMIESSVAPTLLLPADRAERFARNLATTNKPLASWSTYTTRPGDKLAKIAAANGISADRLAALNGLALKTKLAPGHTLLVPARGARGDTESFRVVPVSARPSTAAPATTVRGAQGAGKGRADAPRNTTQRGRPASAAKAAGGKAQSGATRSAPRSAAGTKPGAAGKKSSTADTKASPKPSASSGNTRSKAKLSSVSVRPDKAASAGAKAASSGPPRLSEREKIARR
jgi:membrane-bound lytic murein transglycosylase D